MKKFFLLFGLLCCLGQFAIYAMENSCEEVVSVEVPQGLHKARVRKKVVRHNRGALPQGLGGVVVAAPVEEDEAEFDSGHSDDYRELVCSFEQEDFDQRPECGCCPEEVVFPNRECGVCVGCGLGFTPLFLAGLGVFGFFVGGAISAVL